MITKIARWFRIVVCQWLISIFILLLLVFTLRNWIDYWNTHDWIRVPATINQVHAFHHHDGEEDEIGDERWDGHGRLQCDYAYEYAGSTYSGSRVSVETFKMNSPRAVRYRELREHYNQGRQITIWVDPKNPQNSAIYRDATLDMYFYPPVAAFWFGAIYLFVKRARK